MLCKISYLLRLYGSNHIIGLCNIINLFSFCSISYLLRLHDIIYLIGLYSRNHIISFCDIINLLRFCNISYYILNINIIVFLDSILLGKRENAIISHNRLINFFNCQCIFLNLDHGFGSNIVLTSKRLFLLAFSSDSALKCLFLLIFSSNRTLKCLKRVTLLFFSRS